jgi:hypothetical protein
MQATATGSAVQSSESPSQARWWCAVLAGAIVSLPLAWLLSFGAALVALLGLFFFSLFGLVIGAVMFRIGAAARPLPKGVVRLGTAIVVTLCWGLAMEIEVQQFPTDKAAYAIGIVSPLPDGVDRDAFQNSVAQFVRDTLANDYGSSGFFGYARWILASSRMEYKVETMKYPIVLRPVQYRWWWGIRVVASIAMLWFGMYSMVAPLSGTVDPAGSSNPTPPPTSES